MATLEQLPVSVTRPPKSYTSPTSTEITSAIPPSPKPDILPSHPSRHSCKHVQHRYIFVIGSSALRVCTCRKKASRLGHFSIGHLAKTPNQPPHPLTPFITAKKGVWLTWRPINILPHPRPSQHIIRQRGLEVPALEVGAVEGHLVGAGAAGEVVVVCVLS